MSKKQLMSRLGGVALLFCVAIFGPATAHAQRLGQNVNFKVSRETQRLIMIVNTSRILTMDHDVPKLLVMNPNVVQAQPLAPNKVHVSARKTGVTQINVWDKNGDIYSVDVLVSPDARELEAILSEQFPHASVKVRPIASSVILSGYVPTVDLVPRITKVAQDYYPSVINNMEVGGAQQVILHTKVMEVSRTKMRSLGFDWASLLNEDSIVQTASGLVVSAAAAAGGNPPSAVGSATSTMKFGIVDGSNGFFGFLEALRQHNLAKVLAEPTLVTISGRPASFNSGGEFPIIVPQSLGTVSVEYRQFGTKVDYVPIVLGNGMVRLEVRPQVSEIDPARSVTINSVTVPGLRTRYVDTAVEMRVGQTLALAGLIQTRVETENRGLPWLADIPYFGVPFRRVEEQVNEIELLILVTPQFIDAVEPHQVPAGPGQLTRSPTRNELFFKGHLELPNCNCGDTGCRDCQAAPLNQPSAPFQPEQIQPQVQPTPATNQQTSYLRGYNRNTQMFQNRNVQPTFNSQGVAVRQGGYRNVSKSVVSNPYNRRGSGSYSRTSNYASSGLSRQSVQHRPTQRAGESRRVPQDSTSRQHQGLIGPVGYDVIK